MDHLESEETAKLVYEVVGFTIAEGMEMHRSTLDHMIGTGALALGLLRTNHYPEPVCQLGAIAAGLHDVGKFNPVIMPLVTSSEAFSPEQRESMSLHTQLGYQSLAYLGIRTPEKSLKEAFQCAATSALYHHNRWLTGSYATSELALPYGLAHVTQFCDIAHALGFDQSRSYIAAREGHVLGPDEVADLLRKRFVATPPIVEGRAINVEEAIDNWFGSHK